MYGADEKCIQNFGWKSKRKKSLGRICIDGKIIIKTMRRRGLHLPGSGYGPVAVC
jgi:hypothetical protein